jgi:threonine/homoserine/homoserine lactone efflux protein
MASEGLQLLGYAGVVVLGAMSPGPDFAVVSRHSALGGRGPGLAASAGVASGMVVNTVMAMIGLGAALAASKTLYTIVKLIGAAYLVYLGVTALWSLRAKRSGAAPAEASGAAEATESPAPEPVPVESRLWTAYRRGFFANFLNPKVVVFLVTLMPQFLPKRPTVEEQVLLGIVTVVMVLLWFSTVALLVSLLRKAFQRPRVAKVINGLTGVALIAVAGKIALD